MTLGGKSQPIHVVTDAEIASGQFTVAAGPAIAVDSLDASVRGVTGGNCIPVYPVDIAEVNRRGLRDGLQGAPVTDLTDVRPVMGLQQAIPVYVLSGVLGGGATPEEPISLLLSQPMIDSMLAWWPLDGNGLDVHGSNHLTNTIGTPAYVPGKLDSAFDGETTSWLQSAATNDLASGGGSYWLSVWINKRDGNCYISRNGSFMTSLTHRDFEFTYEPNNAYIFTQNRIINFGSVGVIPDFTGGWAFFLFAYDHANAKGYLWLNDQKYTVNVTPVPGVITAIPRFTINGRDMAASTVRGESDFDNVAYGVGYVPTDEDAAKMYNSGLGATYAQATGT